MNKPPSYAGAAYATGAFVLWGGLPLYWKFLAAYPALYVLSHRILWSTVFVGLLILISGGSQRVIKLAGEGRVWRYLVPSTLLIGANWWIYIWAVNNGHVLETSLGYFMNPLVNILFGSLFLGERLKRIEKIAVALVIIAVVNLIWHHGQIPWISLALAVSFGMYGLVKKKAGIDSLSALFLETAILSLPVGAYLALSQPVGGLAVSTMALLAGAGIVTALPLYFFGEATSRLRLSTLGVFQYIAPSMQFLLAIVVFHEPLKTMTLVSFILVWIALVLFTGQGIRTGSAERSARRA